MSLYAHLSATAIEAMTMAGSPTGRESVTLEGHGTQLITLGTLRDWLNVTGDVRVRIRPVIDLNARLVSAGRFPTDLQREQLRLRDKTCVAPHCNRPARHTDADHIDPWDDSDEGGPPGRTGAQTHSDNLASVCRHHHRAKTFTTWGYTHLHPGVFL